MPCDARRWISTASSASSAPNSPTWRRGRPADGRTHRELVEQGERALAAVNDEAFLVGSLEREAEDAALLLVGAADILEPPGSPERSGHEAASIKTGRPSVIPADAAAPLGPGRPCRFGQPDHRTRNAARGPERLTARHTRRRGPRLICGEDGNDTILGGAGETAVRRRRDDDWCRGPTAGLRCRSSTGHHRVAVSSSDTAAVGDGHARRLQGSSARTSATTR